MNGATAGDHAETRIGRTLDRHHPERALGREPVVHASRKPEHPGTGRRHHLEGRVEYRQGRIGGDHRRTGDLVAGAADGAAGESQLGFVLGVLAAREDVLYRW